MKNFIFFLTLIVSSFSFSQSLQLSDIKEKITNPNSSFYYEKLVSEFKNSPKTLLSNKEKAKYLYYGKLYSPYYEESYRIKSDYYKFMRLVGAKKNKKYKKAVEIGEELLQNDPVNLMVIMNLIISYNSLKENEIRLQELKSKSEVLMAAIADYGNGTAEEKAFKVITLADEITLLNYLGVNMGKYDRTSTIINSNTILDNWTKHLDYKEDKRDYIYIEVYYNSNKLKF